MRGPVRRFIYLFAPEEVYPVRRGGLRGYFFLSPSLPSAVRTQRNSFSHADEADLIEVASRSAPSSAAGILFSSRKACLPSLLCAFASLRELFFFSRKNAETCPPRWAQRNCDPLGLTSGGLGGLAALRALFFFFILEKTQRRKEIVVVM